MPGCRRVGQVGRHAFASATAAATWRRKVFGSTPRELLLAHSERVAGDSVDKHAWQRQLRNRMEFGGTPLEVLHFGFEALEVLPRSSSSCSTKPNQSPFILLLRHSGTLECFDQLGNRHRQTVAGLRHEHRQRACRAAVLPPRTSEVVRATSATQLAHRPAAGSYSIRSTSEADVCRTNTRLARAARIC